MTDYYMIYKVLIDNEDNPKNALKEGIKSLLEKVESGESLEDYFDVEESDLATILFAPSIGSAFNRLISKSDKYRFEKVF